MSQWPARRGDSHRLGRAAGVPQVEGRGLAPVAKPAFIVHFAGCSMCSGFHADRLGECDAQFLKTYAEAFGRLSKEATQLHLL